MGWAVRDILGAANDGDRGGLVDSRLRWRSGGNRGSDHRSCLGGRSNNWVLWSRVRWHHGGGSSANKGGNGELSAHFDVWLFDGFA